MLSLIPKLQVFVLIHPILNLIKKYQKHAEEFLLKLKRDGKRLLCPNNKVSMSIRI